ncbi:hypothetical protein CRENBAI_025469 [Crenichthys baileyi]|uniref:Uncharacterized protein n=1 Tax=Crenichthys baileyi TaxID=28760 RepID=A0AAV9SMQ6_9TELE
MFLSPGPDQSFSFAKNRAHHTALSLVKGFHMWGSTGGWTVQLRSLTPVSDQVIREVKRRRLWISRRLSVNLSGAS